MAERIQRKRSKGWRMPEGAVYVGRPSKWGNPYSIVQTPGWPRWGGAPPWVTVGPDGHVTIPEGDRKVIVGRDAADHHCRNLAAQLAVDLFREAVKWDGKYGFAYLDASGMEARHLPLAELVGRNLACWCPLDQPCHADVLLEIANPTAALAPPARPDTAVAAGGEVE